MARAASKKPRVTILQQSLFRTTLEDFELEGVPLMKHQKVLVLIAAAGGSGEVGRSGSVRHQRRVTASQIG